MNQIEPNRMGSARFGSNQLCALRGVNVLWNDLLFGALSVCWLRGRGPAPRP